MRIPIIAGNWKMNKTRDEALKFIYEVSMDVPSKDKVESVIFSQFLHLRSLVKRQGENIRIGAQNMHFEDSGAYTGEVSPISIKELGVEYVLVGHSERRAYYNETDESVNKKLHTAYKYGLKPIVCVGENLEDREQGKTNDVVKKQITEGLLGLTGDQVTELVIAYEPIWAIGTGKTATSEMANETCGEIRAILSELYSNDVAEKVRIQYGGSVKPSNIKELLKMEHIDGALVGGASLVEESFLDLVNAGKEA